MEELLKHFSISDIVLFIVLFAVAIKGIVDFIDWAHNRLKEKYDKENSSKIINDEISDRLKEHEERIHNIEKNQNDIIRSLDALNDKINILIESDKDDIKADLTRIHHYYCYNQKWIDDYTLECCEKRYKHYTDEGGNSFIEGFMNDLRKLPKKPPENAVGNIIDINID